MLGARIAALRLNAGLSQADLAAMINVSPSTIGMYEQGRREPSPGILVCLAKALGVTADYLLDMEQTYPDIRLMETSAYSKREAIPFSLLCSPAKMLTREELAVLYIASVI